MKIRNTTKDLRPTFADLERTDVFIWPAGNYVMVKTKEGDAFLPETGERMRLSDDEEVIPAPHATLDLDPEESMDKRLVDICKRSLEHLGAMIRLADKPPELNDVQRHGIRSAAEKAHAKMSAEFEQITG